MQSNDIFAFCSFFPSLPTEEDKDFLRQLEGLKDILPEYLKTETSSIVKEAFLISASSILLYYCFRNKRYG